MVDLLQASDNLLSVADQIEGPSIFTLETFRLGQVRTDDKCLGSCLGGAPEAGNILVGKIELLVGRYNRSKSALRRTSVAKKREAEIMLARSV